MAIAKICLNTLSDILTMRDTHTYQVGDTLYTVKQVLFTNDFGGLSQATVYYNGKAVARFTLEKRTKGFSVQCLCKRGNRAVFNEVVLDYAYAIMEQLGIEFMQLD